MYPDDFGELSKRKGKLYKFFTAKPEYIKNLIGDLNKQIEEINTRISFLEDENVKSIKELRAVYINRLAAKLSNFQAFYLDKTVTLLEAVNDEFFNKIKAASNITYSRYEHQYGNQYSLISSTSSGIKFSSIEKEVSAHQTYEQREKLVQDRINNQLNILKVEKEKIRSRLSELNSLSIQEIFELVDVTGYLDEFQDSYLMQAFS
jgi:hypothetical protein